MIYTRVSAETKEIKTKTNIFFFFVDFVVFFRTENRKMHLLKLYGSFQRTLKYSRYTISLETHGLEYLEYF